MDRPQNYRMTVAYDGTDLAGFQIQPGLRTVQGTLEQALVRIGQSGVRIHGAGRTDAGVHAVGQVASFRAEWRHPPQELERALNAVLPNDVAVRDVAIAAESFDARFSALSREYVYRIYSGTVRMPCLDRYAWRVNGDLDISGIVRGAEALVGERDYRSFGQATAGRSTVRRVTRVEMLQVPDSWWNTSLWEFHIEANGFLRGMVRRIVATLVKVGLGEIDADTVMRIIEARDPARSAPPAPACGLFFWRARYPGQAEVDLSAGQLAGRENCI